MGNCQAAEAATVVIVHPAGKVDRVYWSVSANQIMSSNPGHYVAHLVCSPSAKTEDGKPVRHLKLLRPDDTLHIGQVYRLISFEDVLKEFAAKKCVKLGKLLKETRGIVAAGKRKDKGDSSKAWSSSQITASDQEVHPQGSSSSIISSSSSSRGVVGRHQHYHQGGQWRPALPSISEVGS